QAEVITGSGIALLGYIPYVLSWHRVVAAAVGLVRPAGLTGEGAETQCEPPENDERAWCEQTMLHDCEGKNINVGRTLLDSHLFNLLVNHERVPARISGAA